MSRLRVVPAIVAGSRSYNHALAPVMSYPSPAVAISVHMPRTHCNMAFEGTGALSPAEGWGGRRSEARPGAADAASIVFTAPDADLRLASTRGELLWLAEH